MMIVIAQENLMGEQIRFKHNSAAFFYSVNCGFLQKKLLTILLI